MAHTDAPDPRCKAIRLSDEGGFWRNWDTERRMKASGRVGRLIKLKRGRRTAQAMETIFLEAALESYGLINWVACDMGRDRGVE